MYSCWYNGYMRPHPRVFRRLPTDAEPDPKGIISRGECDLDECILYINPKQSDREMLITAVHEALHYIFPKRSEPAVERDGVLIGNVLWKLGYRSRHRKPRSKFN